MAIRETSRESIFSLSKDAFRERRKFVCVLLREYAINGYKFSDACVKHNVPFIEWKNGLRQMLYGYTDSLNGKLFYLAYGDTRDITRQMTVKDRLMRTKKPYYKYMKSLYDRGGEAVVHVILDDLCRSDAFELETVMRNCVREYNLHGISFPGFEQLTPKMIRFVIEHTGDKKMQSFDMVRALERRYSPSDHDNRIADRIDRQVFWTNMMEDERAKPVERLKASELLGRSEGDFIERIQTDVELNISNILDIVRNRREIYGIEATEDAKALPCDG